MNLQEGDQVTLKPIESDPYILQFQRLGTVSRITDDGVYFTLSATFPPNKEFGPFPPERLLPGWRDARGRARRW